MERTAFFADHPQIIRKFCGYFAHTAEVKNCKLFNTRMLRLILRIGDHPPPPPDAKSPFVRPKDRLLACRFRNQWHFCGDRNYMKPLCAILLALFCASATSRAEDIPPVRFSIEHMDLSVDPGADFYRYASGYWIKNTPIPADQSSWVSFVMVDKRNWQLLHQIMESSASATTNKNLKPTSTNLNQRLVGEFYRSAMDSNRIEKLKFQPLADDFARIKGIGSLDELMKVLA